MMDGTTAGVGENGARDAAVKTRREEIVEAATHLFREKGYLATTMRDIADVMGMQGGGSLYAHIKSKEEVLWEIATDAMEAFFAAVRPTLGQPLSPIAKLRTALIAHMLAITARLSAAAVYFDEWRHLSQPRRAAFLAQRDEYEALFTTLLTDGQASGAFAVADIRLATLHLLGAMNAIRHWYKPDGRLTAQQVAEQIADMLLRGLLA
jgi:AcrR family transcriptional regulator